MDKETVMYYSKTALVIVGVIALGLLAFNQFIDWKYSSEQLMSPCELCVKLNPDWKACYDMITRPIILDGSFNSSVNFSS